MRKTNHPKEQPPQDALFRYQVLVRKHQSLSNPDAIDAVANITHITPGGQRKKVSKRSIYSWLADYKENDFAGLLPSARTSRESSALSREVLEDPRASVMVNISEPERQGSAGLPCFILMMPPE